MHCEQIVVVETATRISIANTISLLDAHTSGTILNLTYNQQVVSVAADRFWRHHLGYKLPGLTLLMMITFVVLEITNQHLEFSSYLGAAINVPIVIMSYSFMRIRKQAVQEFNAVRDDPIVLELHSNELLVRSAIGELRVESNQPVKVLRAQNSMVLALGQAKYFAVPLLGLSDQEKDSLDSSFSRWNWSEAA